MKDLTVEQSVRAIFALCSDVSKLTVYGAPYWYFNARNEKNISIVKYILNQNNIPAQLHKTSYYDMLGKKRLIVRTPLCELDHSSDFKKVFEEMYKEKEYLLMVDMSGKNTKLFRFWPKTIKLKLIEDIVERSK